MWIQDTHFLFLFFFFASVGNIFRHQLWKCWNRHVKMHNLPLLPWETACYHMHWNAGILAGWLPQTSPDTNWEEQLLPVNCALLGGHLGPSPSSASVGGQTQPPWGAASACVSRGGRKRSLRCKSQPCCSGASSSRAQSPVPSAIPPCPEQVMWGPPSQRWQRPARRGRVVARGPGVWEGGAGGWWRRSAGARLKWDCRTAKKERTALIWFGSCVCFNYNFTCTCYKVVTLVEFHQRTLCQQCFVIQA